MKVTINRRAEAQDRLTLRVPASLKRSRKGTHALAERKGADYFASIVDAIAGANDATHEKLLQMPDKVGVNSGDKSGVRSGNRIGTTGISPESPIRNINGTSTK